MIKVYWGCRKKNGDEICYLYDTAKNASGYWESWRQTVKTNGQVLWDDKVERAKRKDAEARAAKKSKAMSNGTTQGVCRYRSHPGVQAMIRNRLSARSSNLQAAEKAEIKRIRALGNGDLRRMMGQEDKHLCFVLGNPSFTYWDDDDQQDEARHDTVVWSCSMERPSLSGVLLDWMFQNNIVHRVRQRILYNGKYSGNKLVASVIEFASAADHLMFKIKWEIGI